VALVFLSQAVWFTNSQECDSECATHCNNDGTCVCAIYNDTIGNRPFNGGEFCNTPSHYCNGSLTFWCVDNGGNSTCNTTAGGNFTCSCLPGFAGSQCELTGTACGDGSYCYNNATCLGGGSCSCPSDWQGNANCSLASPEDSSSGGSHIKWWGGLLIAGAVVAVASVLAVVGVHKYRERMEGINRFRELQKSQMRGRAESDDDEYDSDPYEDEVSKKRTAAG